MPSYVFYLLKLSASLGIVWLFYQLLLRKLTFYNWNRWYLLIYSLMSFAIPLVDIRLFIKEEQTGELSFVREFPVFLHVAVNRPAVTTLSAWDMAWLVFVAGAVVMLIRLSLRLLSLKKMRGNATPIDGGGKFFVYDVNKPVIPFSFGRSIYLNPRLHTKEEWKEIILHEYVHVRQHHTIDILVAEILCIVNWYNPFAWLIRFSMRQNLEFIADEQVIGNGFDKTEYQYHLLKVVGVNEYRIANGFNFSSLRKRIIMMNKSKSARLNLVRFLFVFPLLAVLLLAFRNKYTTMAAEKRMEAAMTMANAAAMDDLKADLSNPAASATKSAARKNKRGMIPGTKMEQGSAGKIDRRTGTVDPIASPDTMPGNKQDTFRFVPDTALDGLNCYFDDVITIEQAARKTDSRMISSEGAVSFYDEFDKRLRYTKPILISIDTLVTPKTMEKVVVGHRDTLHSTKPMEKVVVVVGHRVVGHRDTLLTPIVVVGHRDTVITVSGKKIPYAGVKSLHNDTLVSVSGAKTQYVVVK
jgi:hypothetical protein